MLTCLQANSIIQDIRRIVRNEKKVITKLHRRIFLDKITRDVRRHRGEERAGEVGGKRHEEGRLQG